MRVLLVSWGSFGDFYPFLALAKSLRERGHSVTLIGNPGWAETSQNAGIRFVASFANDKEDALRHCPEMIDNRWNGLPSLYHLINKGIVPVLSSTYQTMLNEARNHDLLVAHHFVFPAGMVHEKTRVPWVTVCLAPGVTPSAWHKPASSWSPSPQTDLDRWVCRLEWKMGGYIIRPVVDRPLNAFRKAQGLRLKSDQFFKARSEDLILHLYSENFSPKPLDWDGRHLIAGFCHNNSGRSYHPAPELAQFLSGGKKPWLFTLGTSVVEHPRAFFTEAVRTVQGTQHRAILLIGKEENRPVSLPNNVLAVPYAPHDWLMPRCAAVAHQCGIGTTAEALRAGIPSVCCPYAFDQPNNAALIAERRAGTVLRPNQHRGPIFRQAFVQLLESEAPHQAEELATRLREEDGALTACLALEQYHLSQACT